MTKTLSECPYCKRPADERGGINHVGGCTALQDVPMNRLQYDILRGNLSLAEEGLASYAQQIIALEDAGLALQNENERLQQEVARIEGFRRGAELKLASLQERASHEPFEQLDAGKTKLAIALLERFRDGRWQTANGTHESLLGPRNQLLEEGDWFDHAAKVLRASLKSGEAQ